MKKPIKPSELLEMICVRQKISGQLLLSVFKGLPKVSAIRLPQGFDDSDDINPLLLTLTDAQRTKFKIKLPAIRPFPHKPPPFPPQPTISGACSCNPLRQ
jgi:hypothetical protein